MTYNRDVCLRISLLLDNKFAHRQSVVICMPAKVAMSTFTKDRKAGATSGLVHGPFILHLCVCVGDANRKLWLGRILRF